MSQKCDFLSAFQRAEEWQTTEIKHENNILFCITTQMASITNSKHAQTHIFSTLQVGFNSKCKQLLNPSNCGQFTIWTGKSLFHVPITMNVNEIDFS